MRHEESNIEKRAELMLIDLREISLPSKPRNNAAGDYTFTKELLPKLPSLIEDARSQGLQYVDVSPCCVEDKYWATPSCAISHETVAVLQAAGYDPRRAKVKEFTRPKDEQSDWKLTRISPGKLVLLLD